jgi:hypothetical protein
MPSSKPNVWASLFDSDSDNDDEYVERGNTWGKKLLIYLVYCKLTACAKMWMKTGKFKIGFKWFDMGCVYGNKIRMNFETLKHLQQQVSTYNIYRDQPYYVCRIKQKMLHPTKGKLVNLCVSELSLANNKSETTQYLCFIHLFFRFFITLIQFHICVFYFQKT